MTACSAKLQALLYVTEGAGADADWAEVSTDMTGAVRLPHTDLVSFDGLDQTMIEPGRVIQYLNEITPGIPGPQGGSFQFSVYACGHGSTTSGATAATALGNLLGWFLGGNGVTAANGTTAGNGSTTTNIVTAASGTFAAGGLIRVGAHGDGRSGGHWNQVDSHTLTDLLCEFALPVAPNNGDVVYSAENAYLVESTCAVVPKRFLIKTADTQWVGHGCFPMAIQITGTNPGEVPKWTFTVGVSKFEPVSTTFPDTTSVDTHLPAPVGAGAVLFQNYGTTTRNALATLRACSVDIQLGITPIPGMGNYPDQKWCGAKRQPTTVTATLTVDAEGPSATPTYYTDWATNAWKQLLIGFSNGIGTSLAVCLPRCVYTGKRPTQQAVDDLNRVTFMVRGGTDTLETGSELARSALKIGLG
jgi:hypothetical protein